MLKTYRIMTLLLLAGCGVHSALASCSFTTPSTSYIDQTMASSPVQAVTKVDKDWAQEQIFQSDILVGGPIISTCTPTTGNNITVSAEGFSTAVLPEKLSDGGMLLGGITDGFGYAFQYKVTFKGGGYIYGHLNKGETFTWTPAELDGARWEFRAELWYAGGFYSDRSKLSQISAVNTTYFKVMFDGAPKGFMFHSPAIPITPTTCNLTLDTQKVDFGTFDFYSNMPTRQYITLRNDGCTMMSQTELRVRSNSNPVDADNNLLLNTLTGDNAASGFGVAVYNKLSQQQYTLDAPLTGGTMTRSTSTYLYDKFVEWQEIPIEVRIVRDGKTLKDGDFSATATFNMNYY